MKIKFRRLFAKVLIFSMVLSGMQSLSVYADELEPETDITGEAEPEAIETEIVEDTMSEALEETDAVEPETEESIRYEVRCDVTGDGRLTLRDTEGNTYVFNADTAEADKKLSVAAGASLQLSVNAEEGRSVLTEVSIAVGANPAEKETFEDTTAFEKTLVVTDDISIHAVFEEEPESKAVETEEETESEPESEAVITDSYEGVAADESKIVVGDGYYAESEADITIPNAEITLKPETLLSYQGQSLYVSAGSHTSVYDGGFTNLYNVSGDGNTVHYAYCLQPDAPDPSGTATVYEVTNFKIKLVLCLGMYGPAEKYGFYAGIWPGVNEYNAGALLPAAFGYVHATLGYLYGAGPGVGLYENHVAELDSWVQACLNVYNTNAEVKKIVDNSTLYYMYGGTQQDVAWVEYTEPKNTGSLGLTKSSAIPAITDGNGCYDLAGAVYEVYAVSGTTDTSTANKVGTFKVNSDGSATVTYALYTASDVGKTTLTGMPVGYYMFKETAAPTNGSYLKDDGSYYKQITDTNYQTPQILAVTDVPGNDPVSIEITKIDSEGNTVSGAASLAGAQFEVSYYDGYYTADTLPANATRTWVIETKENKGNYRCSLTNTFKVSGDEFYVIGGQTVLPLGTISIREIKAPEGYKLDGATLSIADDGTSTAIDSGVFVSQVTLDMGTIHLAAGNQFTVSDAPVRGDFEFIKKSEDGTVLSGVEFKITSKTTGESHIVTSHADGLVTSKDTWFGAGTADAAKGSLPYDTYTVEELEGDANFYHKLIAPFEVTIEEDNVTVNLDVITNYLYPAPSIGTTAIGQETGEHWLPAQSNVTIVDTVALNNIIVGRSYTLEGVLMDKSTGKPFLLNGSEITAKKTFTATSENMTIKLNYSFDAAGIGDKDLVVYEYLYDTKNKLVASHEDIEDEGQTVIIKTPDVGTKAADKVDGDQIITNQKEETIVDTVSYTGLLPGKTYEMTGTLMDKATGEALMVGDTIITASTTFVPETSDGEITLEFTLDASALAGKTVVVFESLSYEGKEIAVHADIEDKDQTIEIVEIKIGTKAADKLDGDQTIPNMEAMTIVDTVSYENLHIGWEYTVSGVLMDKATGKPFLVNGSEITSELTFTAEAENGAVALEFSFDASDYAGTDVVVFEELYCKDELIAEHKDIEDKDQTIEIVEIEIKTTATFEDGSKEITSKGTATIADTIAYKNLIPGRSYTVSGVLMDKSTGKPLLINNKTITSEATFTPDAADGSVVVKFTFDATGLGNKELVVFEKLMDADGKVLAEHEDINDKDQTVTLIKPVDTPRTGDSSRTTSVALLCFLSAAVLAWFVFEGMKKKSI